MLSRFPAPAEGRPLPCVWWCPVGPLVCLPLHAAGRHRAVGAEPSTVIDRVVPSCTPTLAALAHSLRDAPAPAPASAGSRTGALVVAVPESAPAAAAPGGG